MTGRTHAGTRWNVVTRVLLVAAIGAVFSVAALAQPRENKPLDLPNGPAKPGFDLTRFSNAGNGWFETFYVKETHSLQKTLEEGKVAADTRVLVTETAAGTLALLMDQMGFHHLAQG